ncbi:MAG: PAS domain S-box protein, partial [Candidatus Saccharibacteria bacterium]
TMETLLEIPPGSNMSHDAPNGGKPDYEIYQNGRMLTSQEMPIQKAVISGRSVQGSEYDIVKYDGKTVNLRGHAVPLFDDQGNVRGAIGAFDDITEHKDMEKRLREMAQLAEKRASELDAVMASIPDGLIIHDREQNLVYLNEYAQCIFQYTEEMLTWSIDERLAISKLYTADSQNVRREDTPMFKALRGEVVDDCELIFKSGIYGDRWASSKSAPIYDGDGAITGTVTTFIDITERKRAEAALRESEEKYRQIVETASEGIIISEPDGTIVFTNLRMADMLGYPREELIGRNGLDLLESGQQEIVDGSRSDLKEGITIRQEYKWLRPDGTCLWTYASISPIKDQMGVHKVNLAMHTDVTERKQVENELRVSEERFRAVLENSLDAAYRRNLQTDTYDYMSPVIKQILGYTPDEMNEMSMDDVLKRIHPDDRQNITDQMEKANEVGYGLFEYRFRTSKGDYRWLADHVKIIKDIYGKPLYRGGILRDITDRKRMEKDLIANRQLLENVINSTPALVLARDMEGRLILLNDALAKRYGVPKEMALGTTLFDFYPTEVAEAIRERDLIVLGEDTIQQFEESVSHNGVPTNYMTTKFPLHDAQGNVYGLGAVITDITERKRVELELERRRKSAEILSEVASMLLSSDHLQEIVEKLCIKVMDFLDGHVFFNYLIDEEKQRLHLNAFAGISQEQAHGIEWLDFGEAVCGTVARDGCRIICENIQSSSDQKYELVRSKGLRAYVCHPLIDKDRVIGTLSFGTRTYDAFSDDDISMMRAVADQVAVAMSRIKIQMAIKESEERYRSIAEELSEVNRRKDEFLAVLSHELRNPLAAVRNSFYLLERSASGSQQALRAGEVIERQVKLLTHLVDDLLDITRINQNKIKLQRQTFDLNEVVQQTLDDHRMLFEKHELFLELQPSPAVVMVNADKARLSQVLGNLLINASKFTGRGGRVRVVVETNDVDGQGVIRVIDNGVGISPELLPNLFQPFVQADTSLERGRGGLGLGLALSKGLIEMHGGSISAYSEGLEMGSEFVIRIPLQEMGPIETALGVDEPLEHRSKVLIIEDNADLAEMLAELLRLRGYQAEYALNGLQGIDKAREFLPEVILCDIGLPRMNGYEVARALRSDERLKDVFLVALSGYALPDDLQKASEAGFEQHLAKPVDLSTLERTLTKIRKVENLESVQH